MKVSVNRVKNREEENAVLNVANMNDSVINAIGLLENGEQTVIGYLDGKKIPCRISLIYYVESVDDKCFAYTKDGCFEVKNRLYELEQIFDFRFIRISKSMICNLRKIKSVKADGNSRLVATLLNGEEVVISRSYVKDIKKRLGL